MGVLLRTIFYMIAVAIVLSLIRSALGAIAKFLFRPREAGRAARPQVQSGGTLRKCPVCGTYAPETTALRAGPSTYYCSEKCRRTAGLDSL